MLIDAHCHLDQVQHPERAIDAALEAGIERIVAVSQDLASMQLVLELRHRFGAVIVTGLGIHPQLMPGMSDGELDEAYAFLEANIERADVIGEVGLDYKWATTDAEQQRQLAWLERQLDLAARHRKPINLHSRRALRQVMNVAIDYQARSGCPAQLHWFTQSKQLVRAASDAGVLISAGPAVLGAADTTRVATAIDDDCLLLETDCPVPFAGASARPHWIRRVLDHLAAARGVDPAVLEARIEANFARMLRSELPIRQPPASPQGARHRAGVATHQPPPP